MKLLLGLLALFSVGICHSFSNPRAVGSSRERRFTILPCANDGGGDGTGVSWSENGQRRRGWWKLLSLRRRTSRTKLDDATEFALESKQEPESNNHLSAPKHRPWRKRLAQMVFVVCALFAVSPMMPWDITPVNDRWNARDARPAISRPAPSIVNVMSTFRQESLGDKDYERSVEATALRKNKVPVVEGIMDEREGCGDPETIGNAGLNRRHAGLSFVTEAVEKVGPSVVRIDTETSLLGEDSGLSTAGFVQQGQGSGLIFSKDGLVLTNAHVVEDASKVTVTLTDGRVFEAEVCGSDEIVDIGAWTKMQRNNEFTDVLVVVYSCTEDSTRRQTQGCSPTSRS